MPRVKSDKERGHIGAWLRRGRLQRDWGPERVVDELAKRGQRIRVDYYRGLEAGRRPGPELLEAFSLLYGPVPEPPPEPVDHGEIDADVMVALIAALEAQTAAMQEIVAEMRAAREATQGRSEGMAAALGELSETIASLRPALAGKSR